MSALRNMVVAGSAVLAVAAASAVVDAQPGQRSGGRRMQMPKMLGEDVPGVGDPFPDVLVYTDAGDPYRTNLLKGKYTVLVFGCLT